MTRLARIGLAGIALLVAPAAKAAPLETYRWHARPVIVFGSEDNSTFREQIAVFNRASVGFRERDIVLIPVSNRGGRQELRGTYRVAPGDFQVLLVGKDGGVKFRSRGLVSAQEIFRLVDAMPMRREEMSRR